MKRIALLAFAALALPAAAQAQRMSTVKGGQLLQFCTGNDRALVQSCEAYINGVSDSVTAYEKATRDGSQSVKVPMEVCIAPAVPGRELRDVVIAWLRQHPEARDREAHFAVMQALSQKFPCGNAGGGASKL